MNTFKNIIHKTMYLPWKEPLGEIKNKYLKTIKKKLRISTHGKTRGTPLL